MTRNRAVGILIALDKYKFVDHRIIIDVIDDYLDLLADYPDEKNEKENLLCGIKDKIKECKYLCGDTCTMPGVYCPQINLQRKTI